MIFISSRRGRRSDGTRQLPDVTQITTSKMTRTTRKSNAHSQARSVLPAHLKKKTREKPSESHMASFLDYLPSLRSDNSRNRTVITGPLPYLWGAGQTPGRRFFTGLPRALAVTNTPLRACLRTCPDFYIIGDWSRKKDHKHIPAEEESGSRFISWAETVGGTKGSRFVIFIHPVTILKCVIQRHSVHSQCCATATPIELQNISLPQRELCTH